MVRPIVRSPLAVPTRVRLYPESPPLVVVQAAAVLRLVPVRIRFVFPIRSRQLVPVLPHAHQKDRPRPPTGFHWILSSLDSLLSGGGADGGPWSSWIVRERWCRRVVPLTRREIEHVISAKPGVSGTTIERRTSVYRPYQLSWEEQASVQVILRAPRSTCYPTQPSFLGTAKFSW